MPSRPTVVAPTTPDRDRGHTRTAMAAHGAAQSATRHALTRLGGVKIRLTPCLANEYEPGQRV